MAGFFHITLAKSMLIRKTQADDLPHLFTLRSRTRENPLSLSQLEALGITLDSAAVALERGWHVGWLCELNENYAGFCAVDIRSGEMLVLAVAPEYEGLGIGRQLLEQAVATLQAHGVPRIWLSAVPDPRLRAYGFYRSQGWHSVQVLSADEEIMEYGLN
ncbi:GNAT family N-acetyltransferase [Chitinibacter sp. ZOR0017]|uniref:GNAT family N-acetyltransferase n=1 Tax=Chitinibacter sp. ZOR0017 TaxID=1339254 RepID=UPI0012E04123|nr:GNAT family N-acetyltransferase [Chitinibacter sp. ZOR0017]